MNETIQALIGWAEQRSETKPKENKRSQENVCARRAIQQILRENGITFKRIGELTNCDHSTVLHSIKKHNEEYEIYIFYKKIYDFMKLHELEILEYYKIRP